MSMIKRLARSFEKVGIGIHRFDPPRRRLLGHYEISHVLDVGANSGQYAKELRTRFGFKGQITSFEPISTAFHNLEKNARGDSNWLVVNTALGDESGTLEINVSENSVSSSFLSMLSACEEAAPAAKYVSHEVVNVDTLDRIFTETCSESDNLYLKIDTQGFEKQVLDGGKNSLQKIDTVELELSLVPLYAGQLLFLEMCEFMGQLGYEIVSIEPGFSDPDSGRVLQVDGIFHRY